MRKSKLNHFELSFTNQNNYKKGIDISHYQNDIGNIDWSKLSTVTIPNEPIKFVFIKVTEGATVIDPFGSDNASNANDYGIPFGYYHFAHPGNNTAAAEVNNFVDQLKTIGKTPTLSFPYMLDLENNKGLSKSDYLIWVNDFIQIFQGNFSGPLLPPIIIYGSPGNLNSYLPSDHDLGSKKLWVADYNGNDEPEIPVGWNDWFIWQYSENGNVDGIIGNADVDWAKPEFSILKPKNIYKFKRKTGKSKNKT